MSRSLRKRARDFLGCYLPLPWYHGREFRKITGFLGRSSSWSRTQSEEYKLLQLRSLVDHAARNVPYYRRTFAEQNLSSNDLRTLDDLRKFPVLTKELMVEHREELKADHFESYRPILTTTSGTTGRGTKLYRSEHQEKWREAMVWHYYRKHGIQYGDPIVRVDNLVHISFWLWRVFF